MHVRERLLSLLTYALVPGLRVDRRGIARLADRELKTLLGKRASALRPRNTTRRDVSVGGFIALGPIVLLSVLQWRWGVLGTSDLSLDTFYRAVAPFVGVPLALVGLVIPFLALSVNLVFSRFGIGAVAHAFRRRGVRLLLYSSLALLAVELLAIGVLTLVVAQSGRPSVGGPATTMTDPAAPGARLMLATTMWWTTFMILLAGAVVARVLRSFNIVQALAVLSRLMQEEANRSLRAELMRNFARSLLERRLEGSGISVAFFQPTDTEGSLVTVARGGRVVDISLRGLHLVQRYARWFGERLDLQIVQPYMFLEDRNRQVAAVRARTTPRLHVCLDRIIRSSVRVRRKEQEEDRLFEVMETYKETVLGFVRGDNESLLATALDGYAAYMRAYLSLGIRLSAETRPNLLSDWRPITLVTAHLDDAIECACSKNVKRSIGMLAHWMRDFMNECAEQGDEYLFARILAGFRTMFYYSLRSRSEVGIDRAHSEPLRTFDSTLFRFGATETITPAIAEHRVKLGTLVVRHLHSLLAAAAEEVAAEEVKTVLRLLQPEELFAHYHPDAPRRKWDWARRLRQADVTPEERRELEDKVAVAETLERFRDGYPTLHRDTIHRALAFVIEGILMQKTTAGTSMPVLSELWKERGDWTASLAWVEGVSIRDLPEGPWQHWVETRRTHSVDTQGPAFTVFVLAALEAQSKSSSPLDIPASRTLTDYSERMANLANELAGDDRWRSLIGIVDQDVVARLRTALEASKKRYEDEAVQSIRNAPLAEEKVRELRRQIIEGVEETKLLRTLLQGEIRSAARTIAGGPRVEQLIPREALIEQDRVSYGGWGRHLGETFGHLIEAKLFEHLAGLVSDADRLRVGDSAVRILDEALSRMSGQRPNDLVILAPFLLHLQEKVWKSEHFVSVLQAGEAGSDAFGLYRGVYVYLVQTREDSRSILVADRSQIRYEPVGAPTVELADFSPEEIQELSARWQVGPEKVKERSKLTVLQEYRLHVGADCRVIRLDDPRKPTDQE